MKYPSLLYFGTGMRSSLAYEVFDDIKLTVLLSENVIDAVLPICTEEDILFRREVFVCAENEEFRTFLAELSNAIDIVAEYSDDYDGARTDDERSIIYVGLIGALLKFYKKAALICGNGKIISRFSDFFKNELEQQYMRRMSDEYDSIIHYVSECTLSSNLFVIRGESMKISCGVQKTFVKTISECAENLGLKPLGIGEGGHSLLSQNIVSGIASLYPVQFKAFSDFHKSFKPVYSRDILKYRSEINFYLEFCTVFDKIRNAGIPLNYPKITDERTINIHNAYDVTLLTKDEMKIIPNDASFTPDAPFFYLTGANGGGKTTYLRTLGIALLMFMCGAPVACESAELYIPHNVFTHFPRDERFDKTGRFADEQNRVDYIVNSADDRSVVLLNETYSTTGEESAIALTSALAEKLYGMGAYGIYITHQHSISQSEIPYLNVVVDRDDSNRRTYKVERRRDNQGSFARDVLEKYSLTREVLLERFGK